MKRKKRVAIDPAVSSHGTQSFLPKLCIEASFQNVAVGRYKHSALKNLHLMIDWKNDGESEESIKDIMKDITKLRLRSVI